MKSLSATNSSSWSTPLYCLLYLILIQYTSGHAANHIYVDQTLISEVEPPLITLNITGQGLSGSFDVDFRDEASIGLDIYDAFRPINFSSTFVEISHIVNDQRLARSILPTDLSNEAVLPLEIRATTAGTFTITAAIDNLPAGWAVILKDTENSTTILLNDGSTTSIGLPKFAAKRVQSASRGTIAGGEEVPSTSAADRFTLTISPGLPPTSDDANLFGVRDRPLVFDAPQLPFSDVDTGDTLSTLLVTASPANGDLIRDSNNNGSVDAGEIISPPDTISRADLDAGKLKWLPSAGQSGFQADSLRFKVGDGVAFSNEHIAFLSLDDNTVTIGSESSTAGWRFISNPFDAKVSEFLESIWTQGFPSGADISSGSPNIFQYQESTQSFSALSGIENSLPAASGLAVFMFTDDDALSATEGGWPKTLTATGTPQTDTVTVSLSNTDADLSGDLSNEEGWNLIGNPFGTAISVDSVLADVENVFTGVSRGVYIWDPEANSGVGSYLNLQANNNERIAPFQAFFVRILDVNQQADVVFSHAIRTRESIAFRKQVSESDLPVRINLEQNGVQSTLAINFREQAKAGIDRYDGFHLPSLSTQTHVMDGFFGVDGQRLVRAAVPRSIDEQVRLPISIQSTQTGAYTLRAQIGTLPNNTRLELHNVETGEIMPLTDGLELKADQDSGTSDPKENSKRQTIPFPGITSQGDESGEPVFYIIIRQGTATDIADQNAELPAKITLHQNYPNPFNPSTTIEFSLPKASQVRLNVYTLSGRRVATLIQGQRSAGSHRAVFNAQNVSSGIYMYRLQADEFTITRKMVLIK